VFKSVPLLLLSQQVHEIQFGALHSLDQAGGNQDTHSTMHITDFIYDTRKNNFQLEVELMNTTFETEEWQNFLVLHD
jgi:hypothetical protein